MSTNIDNWTIYGPRCVLVEVYQQEEDFYQGAMSICLDDGDPEPENVDDEKWISVMLDNIYHDKLQPVVLWVYQNLSVMFGDSFNEIDFVFHDLNGECHILKLEDYIGKN